MNNLLFCVALWIPSLLAGVEVELVDGSTINGEVSEVTENGCKLTNAMGIFILKREALTAESQENAGFVPRTVPISPASEIDVLKAEIHSLRATIESLKKENGQLRKQLATKPQDPTVAAKKGEGKTVSDNGTLPPAEQESTGFWLAKSGKRHNTKCRYYQTGQGHSCGAEDGVACKICGG
ncbi:MAG: hypothetical protein SFY80_13070 [Verrucomicrobiota bacterium]|nr:hypothetical protein [Verrucomicrobiota bacterium]